MRNSTESRPRESLALTLFLIFQRLVAVASLVLGLQYWSLLIGVHDSELWRFDLMPVHWRVAASSLAVLYPVAAVGLWIPVSWGPVVWFTAASGEAVMYLVFPDLFGEKLWVVAAAGAVAAIYVVFRVVLFLEKRRARRPVRVDSL